MHVDYLFTQDPTAYKPYVGPLLKLATPRWSSHLNKDIGSFPRKGTYGVRYKISSTRNRNVTLALKCMAN